MRQANGRSAVTGDPGLLAADVVKRSRHTPGIEHVRAALGDVDSVY